MNFHEVTLDQERHPCQGESQRRVMEKLCRLNICTLYLSSLCISIL